MQRAQPAIPEEHLARSAKASSPISAISYPTVAAAGAPSVASPSNAGRTVQRISVSPASRHASTASPRHATFAAAAGSSQPHNVEQSVPPLLPGLSPVGKTSPVPHTTGPAVTPPAVRVTVASTSVNQRSESHVIADGAVATTGVEAKGTLSDDETFAVMHAPMGGTASPLHAQAAAASLSVQVDDLSNTAGI